MNKTKKIKKNSKQFLFNPNNPEKSFDVLIKTLRIQYI